MLSAPIDPEVQVEATITHGVTRRTLTIMVGVATVVLAISILFITANDGLAEGLSLSGSDGQPVSTKCLARLRPGTEAQTSPNCSYDSPADPASLRREYGLVDGRRRVVENEAALDGGCGAAASSAESVSARASRRGSCS